MWHASRRCGGHQHLRIEGTLTKASATYTEELSMAIALDFQAAFKRAALSAEAELPTSGLEGFSTQ